LKKLLSDKNSTRRKKMGLRRNYRHRESARAKRRETAHFDATDPQLVQSARHGDEAAFHELVDRYASGMFGLAFSLLGNTADAEDVVQETFLGAFRGLGAFKGRSSVKTWLTRILVRQAARCHRSRGIRKTVSFNALSEASVAVLRKQQPGPSTRELDIRMDVLATLETLSEEHREVIVLRELQGMSYDEIAEVLDIPRGTVESRLYRARQELKERLKGYPPWIAGDR